jgi:hypothetical protein
MNTFNENLSVLINADHVYRIALFDSGGAEVGVIENKPGSQGSIRVYYHLLQKWGNINAEAAREGLAIYAEHTADARSHPGKHPNIDRLLAVVAGGGPLRAEIDYIGKNC